MKSAITALR